MGYRIESYTFDELQRVALPGTAATALFWAIPLGNWPPRALDNLWNEFKHGNGVCRELGLLLAKDKPQGKDDALRKSNLSDLVASGKLADLLPKGAARHAASVLGESTCGLLICSGAYPQPGWGVWMAINNIFYPAPLELYIEKFPKSLERHIENILSTIPGLNVCNTQIKKAADDWAKLEEVKGRKPNKPRQDKTLEEIGRLVIDLGEIQSPDNIDCIISFLDRIKGYINRLTDLDVERTTAEIDHVKNSLKQIDRVIRDIAAHPNLDMDAIIRESQDLIIDDNELINKVEGRYRAMLVALLDARKTQPNLTWHAFTDWFRDVHHPNFMQAYQKLIGKLEQALTHAHTNLIGTYENSLLRYNARQENWQTQLREAERAYRGSLAKVSEHQWNLGPEFLVRLEDYCRINNIQCSSIPWDPARMVGWKLRVRRPTLKTRALARTTGVEQLQLLTTIDAFNGSLFADHIYYLAFIDERNKHNSPRQATLDVMIELLGSDGLIDLSEMEGIQDERDNYQLADNILIKWGWKAHETRDIGPLSACIFKTELTDQYALEIDAVFVRPKVESFLKDLIWICISRIPDLSYDNLNDYCPEYTIKNNIKTLEDIIKRIDVGGGLILAKHLLHIAFPTKKEPIDTLLQKAISITPILNKPHHNNPNNDPISEEEKTRIAPAIAAMLATSEEIVGELPWHFTATSRFGTQPMVLSGHAWSHSHPEERVIRVLALNEAPLSDQTLVWNPTRTNPVMTDASFLR